MTNEERNLKLANELKKFLEDNNILQDTRIYFNNKAYHAQYDYETSEYRYVLIENIKPSDYFEYANNSTVCLSFEGPLNYILNYGDNPIILNKFNMIFEENGFYYEFGHSWNLSAYNN